MNKERIFTLFMIIVAAAASRLLPHPPNAAPIAAIALFAGAKFERRSMAFILPLLPLLLSDLAIGFYSRMWVVYLAFAVIVCLGFALKKDQSPLRVLGASLAGSVIFFLITNCAWLGGHSMYPHTLEGLIASYEMGIPFFRNTLIGDLFYTGVLFGGLALAEQRYSWLRPRVA